MRGAVPSPKPQLSHKARVTLMPNPDSIPNSEDCASSYELGYQPRRSWRRLFILHRRGAQKQSHFLMASLLSVSGRPTMVSGTQRLSFTFYRLSLGGYCKRHLKSTENLSRLNADQDRYYIELKESYSRH